MPEQSAAESHGEPSQSRLRSSAGPGYSPAPSTPFTTGAAGACGIVVTGTSSRPNVSELEPAPLVVVTDES